MGISTTEKEYLTEALTQGIRMDGRTTQEMRSMTFLKMDCPTIPSVAVELGGLHVSTVSVSFDIRSVKSSGNDIPRKELIEFRVEVPDVFFEDSTDLCSLLDYYIPQTISSSDLLIGEFGGVIYFWHFFVEVMLIVKLCPSVFDSAVYGLLGLLKMIHTNQCNGIPRVTLIPREEEGPRFILPDLSDPTRYISLQGVCDSLPIPLSIGIIGDKAVMDVDPQEAQCCDCILTLFMGRDSDGIQGLHLWSSYSVDPNCLKHVLGFISKQLPDIRKSIDKAFQ